MTVSLFGVTADLVKKRYFPQWNGFSTNSNPSLSTVVEILDECAAILDGRLLQESIVASSFTVATDAPYLWCRRILRLMVAIEILPIATQQVPPISVKWADQLAALWKDLDDRGRLALGGQGVATSQPDGPTHHITQLGLDVGDPALDASHAIPAFRADDDQ